MPHNIKTSLLYYELFQVRGLNRQPKIFRNLLLTFKVSMNDITLKIEGHDTTFVFFIPIPKCWTAIWFLLCNCRAMNRRNNTCTCWILLSQQQKGLYAAFLKTTKKRMGLKFLKFYNHIWAGRLFYPSKQNRRPAMPKGRNQRLNCHTVLISTLIYRFFWL